MTKIRVVLDGGDYSDVAAELLTFEDDAVVLWSKGSEIGRHSRERVTALDLTVALAEIRGRSPAAQERLDEIRRLYPNAYRPWSSEHEERLQTSSPRARPSKSWRPSSVGSRAASRRGWSGSG